MKKNPQYFYIHDHDKNEYTFIGPFWNDHFLTELVAAQQKKGRNINCCLSPEVDSGHVRDFKYVLISQMFPGMALSMEKYPPK